MALESGTRRVRMVGAEHWTDTPERELSTMTAGGDTYAVHERLCIDSARVRLVLAEGEDVAAALREVYGEPVRDVRVYRLVDTGAEVVEGLPEWRLTLPLVDDPAFDPLPGMILRLAGGTAAAAVEEPAPAVEPVLEADPVSDVPALAPLAEDETPASEPVAEPAALEDLTTVFLPDGPALPEVAADEAVVEDVSAQDVSAEAVEAAPEVEVEPEPAEIGGLALAAAAATVAAEHHDDPFAMPAETVFPAEAVEAVPTETFVPETVAEETAASEVAVEPAYAEVEADVVEPLEEPVAEAEVAEPVVEEPVAEPVAEVVPEPEPEPDPRDLHFAAVAAVLDAGRPACAVADRDGACSAASDVVWQTPAGAAWACAWHWPSAMAGYPGAEVGAVRTDDAWSTWRDGDSVALARRAADLFADAAREHGSPVARALVALDRLDEMLTSLPDDLRGAVLLWSISVTNPEWEVAAVVEHGRVTHDLTVANGRVVAFPDELYFQEHVVAAPIAPVAADAAAPVESGASGETLFARGTAFAAAGDRRAAQQAWTEAAEDHQHALAMRALGDLAGDRDDPKTAEEWYGRAAMLNDTPSMNRIATLLEGRGQQERAAEWLRRAARFGDEEAARRLQHDQAAVAASV